MAQLKDLIVTGPTRLIGEAYGRITSAQTVPVVNNNANLAFNATTTIATIGGVAVTAKLPAGGYQGNQGNQGRQGNQGPKGGDGTNATGVQGRQGNQGRQGPKGGDGTNATGVQGRQGNQGNQGRQGPKGGDGTNATGVQGRQGNQGNQGRQGPKGGDGTNATGVQGRQGNQGNQGPKGGDGTNATGVQGRQGNQGNQGRQGNQGNQGRQGNQGNQGRQGNQGPKGGDGTSGKQGNQGPAGPLISIAADSATKHYLLGMTGTGALGTGNTHVSSTGVYWENNNLYATSDERLKEFLGDVKVDFNELLDIPKKYFRWRKEGPQGPIDIGTSAQKVREHYPELVTGNEGDYFGVAYDKMSIIALAAIDKLHNEVEELKERISKLENK